MMAYKGKFTPQHPEKYKGNPDNIIFRSLWERKLMVDLDDNPNVVRWMSEEFSIPYVSPKDGRVHRYFPDFLIQVKDMEGRIRNILIEIKPHKETQPPKQKKNTKRLLTEQMTWAVNMAKWRAAKAWCEKHNVEFKIVTERDLFPKNKV